MSRAPSTARTRLQPPGDRPHRGEPLLDRIEARARRRGRGSRGERVHHVVLAGERQPDTSPPERARQFELGREAIVGQPRPRTSVALKSARSRMPKVTMRPAARARPCQNAANRSSALITAVSSTPSASNISPLPRATPSIPPKPSRCAGPALMTSPTSGSQIAARCAISPLVVRAHLDHREAVRGVEARQRERHADVVVQVSPGDEARTARSRGSRRSFP